MEKIFCIGFQKTATSSIAVALEALGFEVAPGLWKRVDIGDYEPPLTREILLAMAHDQIPQYDAFADNPWPLLWRELDESIPDAKFILTVRDEQAWYQSLCRMFRSYRSPLQDFIYGGTYPEDDEAGYIGRFHQHNAEVREYFKMRPGRLLELSVTEKLSWEPLCTFLHRPIPDQPFPHRNRAIDRERRLRWPWVKLLRLARKKYKVWTGEAV